MTPEEKAAYDKQIADLKSTIDSFGKKFDEIAPFIDDASVLISAIYSTPELKENVQKVIKGERIITKEPDKKAEENQKYLDQGYKFHPETGEPLVKPVVKKEEPATPVAPESDARVDSLDAQERMRIVKNVETKLGYQKLNDEESKALRGKVTARLNTWAGKKDAFFATPVHELEQKLTDAYFLEDIDNANKAGTAGELITARTSDVALPAISSEQAATDAAQLSPDHKKWAGKLDVPEDKVSEALKEMTEKGVATYKPKEKEAEKKETPSGTPAVPATTS